MKSTITIEEFGRIWLENVKKPTVKPLTFDKLCDTLRLRINPFIGKMRIKDIRPMDIQSYINSMVNSGKYSRATVVMAFNTVRDLLHNALANDITKRDCCLSVVVPQEDKFVVKTKDMQAFSKEDIKKIKKEAVLNKYQYGNMILFLLNTGLRVSEALALKWENLDEIKGTINIVENIEVVRDAKGSLKRTVTTPKTKKGKRVIIINQEAKNALMRLQNALHHNPNDLIFTTETGAPAERTNVSRCLKAICRNAKTELQTGSVHALRHTFATELYWSGKIDLKTLSAILGHAKTSTTLDIYTSLLNRGGAINADINF